MDDTFFDKLQYDENAPDVKSIMAQIRGHVTATRPLAGPDRLKEPGTRRLGSAVYEELEQARSQLGSLHVGMYVTPVRVPIIGGLLQRVRRAFHQLTVYYVGRLADTQTRINSHLVGALTGVVTYIDSGDQDERVRNLEVKVHELESRVRTLESALNQSRAGQSE